MFTGFFDTLKEKGFRVTLSEWLTLQEALDKGLCESSLTQFYYVARMILVKSETEYDKFDLAFEEYFKNIVQDQELSEQLSRWLDKPEMNDLLQESDRDWLKRLEQIEVDKNEVEEKFKERLKDQDSEHNGGAYWIGTMGKTSFGNTGGNVGGIRVGGKKGDQSAFHVIGESKEKDYRDSRTLYQRQLQQALND